MQPQHLTYLLNPGLCHVMLTYPETRPCMLFLFVGSSLCTPASFRRPLAVPPLPSASTCANVQSTFAGFMYRGFSPHKFTPMPGVHKRFERDLMVKIRPAWNTQIPWQNGRSARLTNKGVEVDPQPRSASIPAFLAGSLAGWLWAAQPCSLAIHTVRCFSKRYLTGEK